MGGLEAALLFGPLTLWELSGGLAGLAAATEEHAAAALKGLSSADWAEVISLG